MRNRYWIVLACAVGLGLGFGPLFMNTLPTLIKPLAQAFGWSRAQASSGIAIATLFQAFGMPLVGRLMDRFGVRPVVIASTLAFSAMLYVFSLQTGSFAMYLVLSAVLGIAAVGSTPLSYMALLAKWFDGRLGAAMGVAMVGIGLGYAGAPTLVARWSQSMGWQGAFAGLAALAALGVVNAWLLLYEPTRVAGSQVRADRTGGDLPGLTLAQARGTKTLWLLAGIALLISTAVAGTAFHLVSMMGDRGYTLTDAAAVGSVVGVAVLVSRLLTGFLLDRFPVPRIACAVFLAGAAGMLMIWFGATGAAPYAAAFCLGVAGGAEGDILPYASRRYFGMRSYGQIYGILVAMHTLGVVVGPLLMGVAFDRGGGYGPMLLVFSAVSVLMAGAVLLLGHPRFEADPDARSVGPSAALPGRQRA